MLKPAWTALLDRWGRLRASSRDGAAITLGLMLLWVAIERTKTCDRFFVWVERHPEYEVDSAILAFLLSSFGMMVYALRRKRELEAEMGHRQVAEARAHRLAVHDPLTGLPNRRALNEALEKCIAERVPVGVLLIDLDRFKAVNDVHGHMAGDRLLRIVARRLKEIVGADHTAYRLGGDEFAILSSNVSAHRVGSVGGPHELAEKIVQTMSRPFEDGRLVHHIGASVGLAQCPDHGTSREVLIRRADIALYRAKEAGRGRHLSFQPVMDAEISRRAEIERDLRLAIQEGHLRPFYQPLVDLATGRPVGFELLARWPRTDGQREVGPDQFIPIAEECGLISDLMFSLLEQAIRDAADWDPALTIALNISPVQLKDPWLAERVLATVIRSGFAPQRLAIEITENALIGDADNALRTIRSFKNQGMTIGLDDFGTGYSSLHHLRMLPFDKIKIDRSFVQKIASEPESLKIVRAITSLAISMDLPVIAEGVESAEVVDHLLALGCAQGQGYYFGHPLSADAATRFLNTTQAICDVPAAALSTPIAANPIEASQRRQEAAVMGAR